MIDRLPPDVLAVVAESLLDVASASALGCCCHELRAALALAQPRLQLHANTPTAALRVEACGLWRLSSLTLVGGDADMKRTGFAQETWDIYSVTAAAQAANGRVAEHDGQDVATAATTPLSLLASCAHLTSVTIDGMDVGVGGLHELASLPLEHLALRRLICVRPVACLEPLAACERLVSLELASCWRLADLSPLAACRRLQHLVVLRCPLLAALAALPTLRSVAVCEAEALHDLWPLSACPRLERVSISVCHLLEDLSPLSDCARLVEVELDCCLRVRSLAPLGACAMLRALSLRRCPGLSDLSALATCAKLQKLQVCECKGLAGFSAPCRVARALQRRASAEADEAEVEAQEQVARGD